MRNPLRPAVIVPTQAVDAEELTAQCAAAAATGAVDAIEWRIDPLLAQTAVAEAAIGDGAHPEDLFAEAATRTEGVLRLLPHAAAAGLPVLLTVRTAFEGGLVEITEGAYAEVLRRLITGVTGAEAGPGGSAAADGAGNATVPVAIDVEIDRAESRALIAAAKENGVPIVASHHNFTATDPLEELRATFRTMAEAGADVAKVAMMPQTPADVLRLLDATAEAAASSSRPVLGISMGPLGRTSRIMGSDFGSCASFAQLGTASAPGQIDAVDLAEVYDRIYR